MSIASSEPTVDKSSTRVQRMFGEIAPRYDFLNHLLSMNVDRYWRWRTVRKLKPQADAGPILDVCTGTGDLAIAFDKGARGRVPIVAADFCHEMLELGEEKSQRRGSSERITFVEGDTEHLPVGDNEFQIVSVAFGLRNVSDTDRGLGEMTRVAKPGGKVAVLEFTTPRHQPMKALYGWYFRNVLPRIGQFVMRNNSAAYEYLPESVGEFLQYEQLTKRMEAAGLVNVRFYPMTFGIATLYVGEKPQP
ncbi:bifunctional demethylmenaquinone methyltransferase/2-methoxy-6-polyprenyl-1,4-benzoquinol methylase UbiE [Aeoliella sp. ICT_H6.2]|uniref:Demethylmenaquinone methyltransferase n=1 Tax=Aeoliella straminimaris TaxID=2954799 RepID=A0A9X2JHC5_9BACT|nr:bifunctional demethylmenaquinone methyltransferase/2-methoxy-6-polyprenyl-1,4-benzoquinol methylase UbiE [Aeoliella straminimaris]MCO6045656.1 bifunctional demethylmenaquinone methyltransferase/2-methoxy-6-polyprenyl-1,4-benzoquinol methylase UbiE [Aeoliella straminimaris]